MNCQHFENIINDMAREQTTDATARADAMAHSSACARCSARLADERMLSAGLRRLSASADREEAPARVEAQLLAAFRKQQSALPSIARARARRSERLRSERPRSQRPRWPRLVAAAAAALILLALAAIRFGQSRLLAPVERAVNFTHDLRLAPPNPVRSVRAVANDEPQRAQRNPRRNVNRYKEPLNARAGSSDAASEIATDFIPLMHGEGFDSMESGQMVRVELPRSALVSFGLPMNMERADERIKADVVVGNDGLARAIRFVR